ncbi:hypothetical protein GZ78_22115 [Endozoicomonas numazuensis]|uniref:Uncharacterized protein n=2 Tax=Endozoicomonas numazuensis TaxID=1137799 RepID=A0A081NDL7_9GAMM|nr:hypothetical protein GZ78_22115 [Endozoicomonas numazuensis]
MTCLTLLLTCSGQFANASEQQPPDFKKIEHTLLDYLIEESLVEEKAPWLEEFRAITSKGSVGQPLLSDLEDLVHSYSARSDIFETIAPLYLMLLSPADLFRGIDFFSQLKELAAPVPDSIFAYLNTLFQEEAWLLRTLDQYLVQEVADFPEEQALQWFHEKLLEQRQVLYEGITTLEQTSHSENKGALRHFLVALLMIRQPFLRWPAADRYLSDQQTISPDHLRTLTLYRSLLRLRFAPHEKGANHETDRNFLGMKLFASAGEMPTLQDEVDRFLERLESIEQKQASWKEHYEAIKDQQQHVLEQCEEQSKLHDELDQRCKEVIRVNNQQINTCNDEYDRNHAPGINECNQQNKKTAEINRIVSHRNKVKAERKNLMFDWWQRCSGWNYPCPNGRARICYPFDIPNHGCWQWAVTEQLWLDEHGGWKTEYNTWQSEVSYWSQVCDQRRNALSTWKSRCLGLESSASKQNAQCRDEKSVSQALLKDCQSRLSDLSKQKTELNEEKADLNKDYETYLQEKSDLRARIVTLQDELESIQPVEGHCRADDCLKLGFPQAEWDDFANVAGEVYLAMAGPGGKLKAASALLRKVIQTGGRKIFPHTADILNKNLGRNLPPREWGRALEKLKNWERLPPKHHGKIYDNGDYADDAGKILGNIDDFVR